MGTANECSSSFFIDAHCHLADSRYSEAMLEEAIQRSRQVGIQAWVQGGVSPGDWDRQVQIRQRYGTGIVTSYGLHPWWVAESRQEEVEKALDLLGARGGEAQAVGELGLDFMPKYSEIEDARRRQQFAFEAQLEIAKKLNKPLILHIVKAHSEALGILKKRGPFPRGGIVHAFSSSAEIAAEYLTLGFLISIGGAVIRKGYRTLKEALSHLPLEGIVVETDSPDRDMSEPANLIGISKGLAELLGRDYREVLYPKYR